MAQPEPQSPSSSPSPPLYVGIDAHMVGTHETGNETYVVQLAAALGRLGGYHYRLYTPLPKLVPGELRGLPALSVRPFLNLPSFVRIPLAYPALAARDNLRLMHMTFSAPLWLPCPLVLTIHDVSYRIFPGFFSPRVRLLLGLLVGPSARRASRVIAISESTKRDVIRFYGLPPEKVAVTPLAAGPHFKPQSLAEVERVRHAHRLPQRYVLAVGNMQPRKNLPRLIKAFGLLAAHAPEVGLVITGQSGWHGSEPEREVRRLGLEGRVRFTGFVPEADLPALYSGAEIFCYPSLYEGFGLPPLEAMACGTPVVTSSTSSLPEVVGDAALTVRPESVGEIAQAMGALLGDDALRRDYAGRALERARTFSWERTARLTRDVYDQVAGVRR